MPTWITPRRLGATAVLYAVFIGGWYLGQPLHGVGCHTPELATASEDPVTIGEPGDVSGDLSRAVRQVVTYKIVSTDGAVPCEWTPRPRMVAWVIGDWR
ncbi:hypothetical protein ACIHCQ_21820 [Streptomyces sp. NPDC052236]|uniref:hypothetical protein n=1 Tax=Streptomyces sp. NPDC052236 TaxID=3365686 RepID=UPI0037D1D726